MEISVVLPSYREAANLEVLLPELKRNLDALGKDYEILVVDTMEPMDNTEEICLQNSVRYVPREGGNQYGDAIRTGIKRAEGVFLTVMDADGSHNSADISRLYSCMTEENCDLVIGSRYCKGGYTDNPFLLRLMSRVLNLTYRIVFGIKVKDVSNSFRMYRSEQLRKLQLLCSHFDIVEEILIQLNCTFHPFLIREVPIVFSKRAAGESKRSLGQFILSYLHTMRRLLKIKKECERRNNEKE